MEDTVKVKKIGRLTFGISFIILILGYLKNKKKGFKNAKVPK